MLTGGYHLLLQFSISVGTRHAALRAVPHSDARGVRVADDRDGVEANGARAASRIAASVDQQMKLSAKPTVNGEDRPVDVADETVSKDDVRDFPVPALADIRQSVKTGDARRFASRLAP
jgi:hypothetical protein